MRPGATSAPWQAPTITTHKARRQCYKRVMTYSAADVRMVEEHIVQGERHVVRQQELIDRLRGLGLPTAEAERLLREFQETLQQHWDHRAAMLQSISLSPRPG